MLIHACFLDVTQVSSLTDENDDDEEEEANEECKGQRLTWRIT